MPETGVRDVAEVIQIPVIKGLVGTEKLEELIHTVMLTPFVMKHKPISVILVAPSGAGKSQSILQFKAQHIKRVDDLTSKGLFDILERDKEQKIRYIQIPDFNPVLSHKPSVTNLLISNLLTLMSDGIVSIADGRQDKELEHKECGIVTAVTDDMFAASLNRWHKLGIVRRLIPIHYSYSRETIRSIQEAIRQDKNGSRMMLPVIKIKNHSDTQISISEEHSKKLELLSDILSLTLAQYFAWQYDRKIGGGRIVKQGEPMLPFAQQHTLKVIACAHSLFRNDNQVNFEDVEFCESFIRFTNMMQKVEL